MLAQYEVRQPGGYYEEEVVLGTDVTGQPDPDQVSHAEIRVTGTESDTQPAIRDVITVAAVGEGPYN